MIVPPILSFALGTLGFLTPFSIKEYKEQIARVMDRGFHLTLRSRLLCKVVWRGSRRKPGSSRSSSVSDSKENSETEPFQDKPVEETYAALNEVLIDRGGDSALAYLDCYCDGVYFTKVFADGIIIATPTG